MTFTIIHHSLFFFCHDLLGGWTQFRDTFETMHDRRYKNCFETGVICMMDIQFRVNNEVICQKLVLRVSSGAPNTEKQMNARGRRPSTFIVSRCLEPLMKHEARVFDTTSQSRLKIQCNKACKNNVFPAGMVNSSCKSQPVFRKPFVPC